MILFILFLLLSAVTTTTASLLEQRVSPIPIKAVSFKAVAFTDPSPDIVTSNFLTLRKVYTDGKRGIDKCPVGTSIAVQEVRPYSGISYLTDIAVNGELHTVALDTGSSDTWLIKSNYTCVNVFGRPQEQQFCNFGPGYTGNFTPSEVLSGVNLNIRYGDKTFAYGQFGYANVTIAGLTSTRQQVRVSIDEIVYVCLP
jgi:hypothetical protein